MNFEKKVINLKIKHYDTSDEPEVIEKKLELYPSMDYKAIKSELFKVCEASADTKVLKLRNKEQILVPISVLVENADSCYFMDVCNISCFGNNANSLLQDAYVDSVCNKVKSLESRVAQAELLLPQLEWRRQAFMEETVSGLLNKVAFLNRRFDELCPKYGAKNMGPAMSP